MIQVADYRFKFRERNIKSGTCILLEVNISGKRWRKSTGLMIPEGSLSSTTGRLKSSKGLKPNQAKNINSYLAKKSIKAERIFLEHADQDLPLSLEKFKRAFALPDAITLRDYTEVHIKRDPYKPSSIQQLRRAVDILSLAYGKEDITIYDLDDAPYVLEKKMVEMGLAFNSRQKYQGRIKTLIRSAIQSGYKIDNPYNNFKIHRIKGVREFLEAEELDTLIKIYESNELPNHLHVSLERFLFSCFTGIRFSDVIAITHKNLHGDQLHFRPIKGERYSQQLKIPLPSVAFNMVKGREGKLFPSISDQKQNQNLKRLMEIANIHKAITFHCARHTFATIFIAIGGELTVLKELLGHSKISTTMEYVKLANGVKKNQIKLFDERFKVIKSAEFEFPRIKD